MGRNKNKHFPFPGLRGHPHTTPSAGKLPCSDQPPPLQPAGAPSPCAASWTGTRAHPPEVVAFERAAAPHPGAYLSDLVNFRNACRRSWKDLYVCGSAEMPCARVVRGPM